MQYPLIGHKDVLNFFDQSMRAGRVSHAYCFVGPKHVGKRRVAAEVSATLFQKRVDELRRIPDFWVVTKQRDEKTGKTKKHISVDQLKEVAAFLSERPFVSNKKIVVIDQAEEMSASAANALLKTLEEPPAYAHVFLITHDDALLPATIRSRCQSVYFHPVSKEVIRSAFAERVTDADRLLEMTRLSMGLPGRMIEWLEDDDSYEAYKREVERFYVIEGKPFHEKIAGVEELFGDKSDHIAARANLLRVLDLWELLIRDQIYESLGKPDARVHHIESHTEWTPRLAEHVYARIEEAKRRLRENVHPRLLVEHILLALP